MTMQDDVFDRVRQLRLPQDEYAIFGSGPLVVRKIITFGNDLDIICRGPAWDAVCLAGRQEYLEDYDTTIVSMADGAITFGTSWGIGDFDLDELIDDAEIIDGLPFVRLRHVIEYKRVRSAAKDLLHLDAIRAAGLLDEACGNTVKSQHCRVGD